MNKSNFITSLSVGIITAVVGVVLGLWLANVYQQPRLEWYSRPYYKVNDIAIGNVYVINTGKKTDRNIAITLATDLDERNVKIVDLVSGYRITKNDNKTTIILEELKPGEAADITFIDRGDKDDSEVVIVSDSSNIIFQEFALEQRWWHLSGSLALGISTMLILIGSAFGWLFGRHHRVRS